jgi:hypothetical protein
MPAFATPRPIAATVEVAGARCGSPRAAGPTPWCWSNPSTAQQADRQEASVTSTSSDQLVCVPSCVTTANRTSPR